MEPSIQKLILLVEDQVIIAMSQMKFLNLEEFEVIHATTGEEAVKIVKSDTRHIDLILMDLDLGRGMDGFDTAKSIQAIRDVPIMFLSSQSEKDIVKKTEQITSYGYILKTAGSIVLVASIKIALNLAESNRRLRESEIKFQKAFKYSPIPISINDISDNNRFVDCNDAFVKSTGYSREEVIGELPVNFNFYPYPEERTKLLEELKEKGDVQNFFHHFQNRAGEITKRSLTLVQIIISEKPYYLVFDIIEN